MDLNLKSNIWIWIGYEILQNPIHECSFVFVSFQSLTILYSNIYLCFEEKEKLLE